MAAVRGHSHLATPFVSRKRPRQEDAGDADAGTGNENEIGAEADTFRSFPHVVTRVYGEREREGGREGERERPFFRRFRQASRCSAPARTRL